MVQNNFRKIEGGVKEEIHFMYDAKIFWDTLNLNNLNFFSDTMKEWL